MEVITVLSLNNDCLCNIVSFISDCSSFNSFARTCRRFRQVTNNSRNCHLNILRSKADYYLKHFIVHLGERYEYRKLKQLVDDAVQCSTAKHLLTHDKVVNVWRESGPVASKIFSWIRNQSSSFTEGHPRATCRTDYKSFTLHLPKCNQEMTVNTSYFNDYIHNYDKEITIKVECGDLKIEKEDLTNMIPEDYKYWSEEEMKKVIEPMKPVRDLLQEELGETIPSIKANFLIWFLFFFPMEQSLPEEDKLIFKDVAKNEKPNLQSIQPMLEYHQKSLSGNFQKSSTRWINTNDAEKESVCCKSIVETLDLLVHKSDTDFLERVKDNISRLYGITTSYDLRNLPEKLIFELILRTTLEPSNFSAGATADKYVDNTAYFRLLESKVMKVHGEMEGDGASYPTWERLVLNFHLPDNKEIQLDTGYLFGSCSKEDKTPLDIEQLSPITKLLQECINLRIEGEKHIPEISDMFTAVYFLHALDFGGEAESFFGTFDESDLIVEENTDESNSDNTDNDDY